MDVANKSDTPARAPAARTRDPAAGIQLAAWVSDELLSAAIPSAAPLTEDMAP
jgi:hypothetical protein